MTATRAAQRLVVPLRNDKVRDDSHALLRHYPKRMRQLVRGFHLEPLALAGRFETFWLGAKPTTSVAHELCVDRPDRCA